MAQQTMLISLGHICERLTLDDILSSRVGISVILRFLEVREAYTIVFYFSSKLCMPAIISICLARVLKLSCHDSQTCPWCPHRQSHPLELYFKAQKLTTKNVLKQIYNYKY